MPSHIIFQYCPDLLKTIQKALQLSPLNPDLHERGQASESSHSVAGGGGYA